MFAMTASLASCPPMRGAPRKQRKRSGKRKARKHRIAYIETYRNKKQHDQATIPVFVGHFSAKSSSLSPSFWRHEIVSSFPGTRFFKPKRLRGCASCKCVIHGDVMSGAAHGATVVRNGQPIQRSRKVLRQRAEMGQSLESQSLVHDVD